MTEICEIFNSKDFTLRTLKIKGKFYFNGNDLAAGLGYKKPRNAINTFVEERDKFYKTTALPQGGGYQAVYISRPAASKFVFQCRLPRAKKFCDWLSEEVLESIYDTGKYELEDAQEFKAIADRTTSTSENASEIKKICIDTYEKLKDQEMVRKGRKGGRACQQKHRETKRELRQTKIDLSLFMVTGKLATHAIEQIQKQPI